MEPPKVDATLRRRFGECLVIPRLPLNQLLYNPYSCEGRNSDWMNLARSSGSDEINRPILDTGTALHYLSRNAFG
jgi:hypothetical protein